MWKPVHSQCITVAQGRQGYWEWEWVLAKKSQNKISQNEHTGAVHAATRAGCYTLRMWLPYHVRSTHNTRKPHDLQKPRHVTNLKPCRQAPKCTGIDPPLSVNADQVSVNHTVRDSCGPYSHFAGQRRSHTQM